MCSETLGFVPRSVGAVPLSPHAVCVADINKDGRIDVLSASWVDDSLRWFRNEGGSPVVWTIFSILSFPEAVTVAAGDIDGDGNVDVVSGSVRHDTIAWLRNNGGATIVWTLYNISTSANYATSVFTVDVDNDGRIDVLSASADDNKIAWYRRTPGNPESWTTFVISTAASNALYVYAADLDGDSRVDALSASPVDNKIVWYKNPVQTSQSWLPYVVSYSAVGTRSVFAADINSDGRVDVLFSSYRINKVSWCQNDGGSPVSWTQHDVTVSADSPIGVHAADVDNDGRVDVLSANIGANMVVWYRNSGGTSVTWTANILSSSAVGAYAVAVADLNSDGRLDVVSACRDDSTVLAFMNSVCPRGRYGPGGYAPCAFCAAGRYGNTSFLPECSLCPAGRFGNANGAVSIDGGCYPCPAGQYSFASAGSCSSCSAGYACPAASANATAVVCGPGQFSLAAASTCTACAAGRWSDGIARPSACSSSCSAGYACPAASTNATAVVCGPGQFSLAAASTCSACAAGRWSDDLARPSACSSNCTAGYACPAGAPNATVVACSPGQYSLSGASVCSACVAGRWSNDPTRTSECSATCSAGYSCPAGSSNATVFLCPAGRYSLDGAATCSACPAGTLGNTAGLQTSACSGACPAGHYCPGAAMPGSRRLRLRMQSA